MAPINFKLTELNGLTRRVTFPDKPSWNSLAAKIELLYGIPIEKVSVSYIDADNDQVTLSSQDELDDFFATSHTKGQAIKFTVRDLSTARLQRTLSQPPRNPSRNTFGIGAFDIEDDWQTLPMPPISELRGLFMPNSSNEGQPHAFVETLGSDTGTVKNEDYVQRESVASSSMSSPDSPFVVPLDKGKQRAVPDDDVSSTGSVLGEDAPPKPPVHVYDFQTPIIPDAASRFPRIPAESTPKAEAQTLSTADVPDTEASKDTKDTTSSKEDPTDPPVSTLDNQSPHTSASFFNDITSFLTTFSNIIAAHPELSEGIRNILRNTTNGTYWHAHSNAMSQTANDIVRETGVIAEALRKETEETARRQVADALGDIFRTLSETFQSAQPGIPPISNSTTNTQPVNEVKSEETVRATEVQGPSSVSPDSFCPFIPPILPPKSDFWTRWGHRSSPLPQPPSFIPLHNTYGPRHDSPLPVPPPPPMPGNWRPSWVPPPPPPIPDLYPPGFLPPLGPSPRDPPRPGPYFGLPISPPPMETTRPQESKPTAQELRAQVDEAKARYRVEKEKYRLDRAERRKEREMRAQAATEAATAELNIRIKPTAPFPPARPITPPVIAVQGRSGQESRETANIHRHHTQFGHGSTSRRPYGLGPEQSDLRTRTANRIAKRLADMGFSESMHPDLPNKIRDHLPFDGFVRNDSEDDIVTTLLEDLLALSPKSPVASGSGTRGIPGAWH